MNVEDKTRELLKSEASRARVSSDAWAKFDRRRRREPWRRAAWVLAGAAVVAGAVIAAPSIIEALRSSSTVRFGSTPSPEPSPSPTVTAPETFGNVIFWPATSTKEAVELQDSVTSGQEAWMRDPKQVAVRFTESNVGWKSIQIESVSDIQVSEKPYYEGERFVDVIFRPLVGEGRTFPGPRHLLRLRALPNYDDPAWFVSELRSDNVVVDTPVLGESVRSPFDLKGRGIGFEGTINTEVRADNQTRLHPRRGTQEGFVMGGSTEIAPFQGKINFDLSPTPRGILIVSSSSGLEGPSPGQTILRLMFAETSGAPSGEVQASTYSADEALRCFFRARVFRSFEAGRKCMTEEMAGTFDGPLEFEGTSSPNVQRFTIHRDVSRSSTRAVVSVRTYEGTSTGLTHYTEDTMTVVHDGGWLVDSWTRGSSVAIGETRAVRVYLVRADFCPGDAGYDNSWTFEEREIPRSDGPGRAALEELFTGPAPRPFAEAPTPAPLPLASRVLSLEIDNGTASLDVSKATESGGGSCSMGIRVDAIERTLKQFLTVSDVRITVEGKTSSQGIFQP